MPKKAASSKKTTTRKKPVASARPCRAKTSKKKSNKKSTKTCARPKALTKAERAAEEARIAEMLANHPRAAAAMEQYLHLLKSHGRDSPEAKQAYRMTEQILKKSHKRASPGAVRLPKYTPNDPREPSHMAERDQLHDEVFAGTVYHRLLQPLVDQCWGNDSHVYDELCATNILHTGDLLRQMQPRDPMEKMLVAQALWTHGRIAHLTDLLVFEKSYKGVKVLSEAIDRASNVFRRQMLALAEYRRPPRAVGMVNKIGQANIANQQIVQNGQAPARPSHDGPTQPSEENTTNELGLQHGQPDPAISAQPRGQTLATGGGEEEPALVEIDRSED